MEPYTKEDLAVALANSGALFFDDNLKLKDGRPSPYFVNFGRMNSGKDLLILGEAYARFILNSGYGYLANVLFGPSYKGSQIASVTVMKLAEWGINVKAEYDRKEPKTHGEGSKQAKRFVNDAFYDKAQTLIVDDVATSMDTKNQSLELIAKEAEEKGWVIPVWAVVIGVDREQKDADGNDPKKIFRDKTDVSVHSILGIREMIYFLHHQKVPIMNRGEKKALDDVTMGVFETYMAQYGLLPQYSDNAF
ncbi:MAG: hypothetical protein Q8Q01_04865 [archaeon]|nr:hypothetical protein [archaeon]